MSIDHIGPDKGQYSSLIIISLKMLLRSKMHIVLNSCQYCQISLQQFKE